MTESVKLPDTVSTAELRWLLGDLTDGRLSQLAKEGIIERVGRDCYTLASVPNFIKRMRDRSEGPGAWQAARVRYMEAKADAAEREQRRLEGELVETEQVVACEAGIVSAWRQKILTYPTKLAARVILCRTPQEAEEIMREELYDNMIDFSKNGEPAILREATKYLQKRRAKKPKTVTKANGAAAKGADDGPEVGPGDQ